MPPLIVLNYFLLHQFPSGSGHPFLLEGKGSGKQKPPQNEGSVFHPTLGTDKALFDYVLQFEVHANGTFTFNMVRNSYTRKCLFGRFLI